MPPPDDASERRRWPFDLNDALAGLGLALLAVGLAGVDWRLAAIVVGGLLLLASTVGAWRGR